MSTLLYSTIAVVVGLPVVIVTVAIFLHRKSFKHDCLIIRQLGNEHIVVKDKFRTRKQGNNDEDVLILEFLKQVKNKSLAPKYALWQKFWDNKKKNPEEALTMNTKELERSIRQGALFYQANQNEVKPITISDAGKLTVLDQDNRAFIASQMIEKQEFMKSGQSKWAQVLMVVGPIVFALIVALVMWIIFNTQMTENVAAICGQANANSGGLVGAVRGVAA